MSNKNSGLNQGGGHFPNSGLTHPLTEVCAASSGLQTGVKAHNKMKCLTGKPRPLGQGASLMPLLQLQPCDHDVEALIDCPLRWGRTCAIWSGLTGAQKNL